jgi:hypothetical protein
MLFFLAETCLLLLLAEGRRRARAQYPSLEEQQQQG